MSLGDDNNNNNKNIFENEVDLNSIFNLNYNFDMLKIIIGGLIKGQKDLQMQLSTIKNNISDIQQQNNSSTGNDNKHSSGFIYPSDDSDLFESEDFDDITNQLIKRIGKIKKRLAYLEENSQLHDKLFLDIKNEIKLIKENNNEEKHTDSFINNNNNYQHETNNNNEMVMNLLKELEKTMQQKFSFIDAKIQKIEKGLANENKNTDSVNNSSMKNTYNQHLENNETQTRINPGQAINQNQLDNNAYKDIQKQLLTISSDLQNFKQNQNNKITSFDKCLKDLQTSYQNSFAQIKPTLDSITTLLPKKDFLKFQETLQSKTETEFRDLKLEIVLQKKALDTLKDQLIPLLDDNSTSEEIQGIKRRLEAFMTQMQFIKDSSKKLEELFNSKPHFDPNKYIDITTFNDFKQSLSKQFHSITAQIDSVNSIIEDLTTNLLQNKASFKDLKNLEDTLMTKLEDLKLSSLRQFSDKIETNKTLKMIEIQIKQMLELNSKRSDKGDSWLLAKKPFGGHLCASCETYIGDLKESTSYVPWNRIPMRDSNDKMYRIGTGFSKMLQMVNVENCYSPKDAIDKKLGSGLQSGTDFYVDNKNIKDENVHESILLSPKNEAQSNLQMYNVNHSLPQIKGKRKTSYSVEYGKDEVIGGQIDEVRYEEGDDKGKPKIMKIVKKQKDIIINNNKN